MVDLVPRRPGSLGFYRAKIRVIHHQLGRRNHRIGRRVRLCQVGWTRIIKLRFVLVHYRRRIVERFFMAKTQKIAPLIGGGCTPVVSRRHLLQIGGLGLAGLSLPQLLQAKDENVDIPPQADACIIIFLNGGPSHLDMWDMKPDQAEGIRGEFSPIATSVPDVQFSNMLPRSAQWMHEATLVRSMHHSVNNAHAAAVYCSLTGHDRGEIGGGAKPDDYPAPGSVMAMLRPSERSIVPQVTLPYITKEGAKGPPQPGFFGGFIGRGYDPLFVLKDPNKADFSIPELTLLADVSNTRLDSRRDLFRRLDDTVSKATNDRGVIGMNDFQQKAFDLLSSKATQAAFQIADEPAAVRDSYGRNIYGQSVLLARRLLEAGTRMVTLSWAPDANATWDTHGNNFKKLKNTLLPQFDAAYASLLDDLKQRGMLERTIVAVLGDFGRSPKVNANAGRDHWNYCYSVLMAGGGFRRGYVHGASDTTGAFPSRAPLIPGDIIATIYQLLGVQHNRMIYDLLNRPHRLVPSGGVAQELMA